MSDTSPRPGPSENTVWLPFVAGIPAFGAAMIWLFPDAGEFACFLVPVAAAYLALLPIYLRRPPRPGFLRYLIPLIFLAAVFGACYLADGIHQVKTSATRMQVAYDLKQIALALWAYHDRNETLPPAVVRGPDGKPLYSWRVALLPYLEEEELFRRFRPDEPWDGPHNRTLLAARPHVYAPKPLVIDPDPAATYYQVFVGLGTAFEGERGLNLKADFPRNPGETILVAEARDAVPWTKPDDLSFAPGGQPPALGAPRHERFGRFVYGRMLPTVFAAAMGDESVRSFRADLPAERLRARVRRTGKEHPVED